MSEKGDGTRRRLRELGFAPGILPPGRLNAITDVEGVRVGHVTLIEGDSIRTGVTAILPHGGNPYREKVRAGLAAGNGFGKLAGATQIAEQGTIETPIVLTNTLAVGTALNALVAWALNHPDNEQVTSVNAFVGETNDGRLNDIRARAVTEAHVLAAIRSAQTGPVAEGCVGAGTGTVAFGLKAGIGTASRVLGDALGGFTLGVLVQANFGGTLMMDGLHVGEALGLPAGSHPAVDDVAGGSCLIVLATDAPVLERNLFRMAWRARGPSWRTARATTRWPSRRAIRSRSKKQPPEWKNGRTNAWTRCSSPQWKQPRRPCSMPCAWRRA
jgi:D-aminopeptidase